MIHSTKALEGYALSAEDGEIGSVRNFYFDDRHWTVRHFVAETASWLLGRRVLIAPHAMGEPDHDLKIIPVALTKERIKDSPGVESDRPVSRQKETEIYNHFGWELYWNVGAAAVPPVGVPQRAPDMTEGYDPNLRSANEVFGYRVGTEDGPAGTIVDFLVESARWRVRYMIVDTGTWLPGRHVVLSPGWASGIDWEDRVVTMPMTRDQLRLSPEYDPGIVMERSFERKLHDHFRLTPYWF